jgi:hypothetical protein
MRGYPTFAEALEHALEAARDDAPRAGDRFVYLPASAAPFVFVYSRASVATKSSGVHDDARRDRGPYAGVQEVRHLHTPAPPMPEVEPLSTPAALRRSLTSEQQRAVLEMAALGAELRPDFTAPELRRAFRRLARQYHPDRYPDADAAGQARLAQIFSDLTDHYRCLMTLFEQ